MQPAARISDMHVCPLVTGIIPHVGGPVALGHPTVLIGGMPAARQTDMCICVGPPDSIAMGSPTVLIGGMPAARMGDMTMHGGVIAVGCPTVLIGMAGMGFTPPGGGAGAGVGIGIPGQATGTAGPDESGPVNDPAVSAVDGSFDLQPPVPVPVTPQGTAMTLAKSNGTRFVEKCS